MQWLEDRIQNFHWSDAPAGNIAHLREHGVEVADFYEVYFSAPRFILSRGDNSSHMMVGQNVEGRWLLAGIMETFEEGRWVVTTAYWIDARRGERLYSEGIS